MKDVYFRCADCGKRIYEPDRRNHRFQDGDIPLRRILEKIKKRHGRILCRECLGGNDMNVDGKNFAGYLTAMGQVNHREREKLLDKARNDKDITVAGYLKLENYALALDGKEYRKEEKDNAN